MENKSSSLIPESGAEDSLQLKLVEALTAVSSQAGKDFTGLGVIIYDDLRAIPVTPLRRGCPANRESLVERLLDVSRYESPFHDGFHLIDRNWELTHFSQYFSPPIINSIDLPCCGRHGGRYAAALFGSCVPGIMMSGIVTSERKLFVFKNGIGIQRGESE